MILLALESSAELSSVAVWKDWRILSHQLTESRFGHAERIINQVDIAIKQAKVEFSQIDFFVGGRGPGSFTGIRTCLAAITGFSVVTNKALYGVNGLSALGFNCFITLKKMDNYNDKRRIFAVSDTRKNSFYFQEFKKENPLSDSIYELSIEELQDKISSATVAGCHIDICGPFSEDFWKEKIEIEKFQAVNYNTTKLNATHIANYFAWQIENDKQISSATPLYVTPAKIFNSKNTTKFFK